MNTYNNLIKGATVKLFSFSTSESAKEILEVFNSKSISELIRKISIVTTKVDCTDYEYGKPLQECENKFKGDLFEVFSILFFINFGGDRKFLIHGIDWAPRDQEGWDFVATNNLGKPVTIQSKFVGNSSYIFEGDGRLETFFGNLIDGQEQNSKTTNKILFTSASKIGSRYERWNREGLLTVVDRRLIRKFTDNNLGFWLECTQLVEKVFRKKLPS